MSDMLRCLLDGTLARLEALALASDEVCNIKMARTPHFATSAPNDSSCKSIPARDKAGLGNTIALPISRTTELERTSRFESEQYAFFAEEN